MHILSRVSPQLLSLLRIMSGLLVLQHGTAKVLDYPVGPMRAVPLTGLSRIAGIIELVFGALPVVGCQSRVAAFVLSGMTAAAYFIAHAPRGSLPAVERRRTGRAVLLPISLPCGGWPWADLQRCPDGPEMTS